jgi:thymidylate synthase (FAD)
MIGKLLESINKLLPKKQNSKSDPELPKVKLVSITRGVGDLMNTSAQEVISYIARVSNPNNQLNFDTAEGLIRYCIKNKHVSIFEHAYMTLEINTTRAIAAQILRHRSFTFQEYSLRYMDITALSDNPLIPELRRQDNKNRQNSIDDFSEDEQLKMQKEIQQYFDTGMKLYEKLLSNGVAKECARFILPLSTPTRIYMTGNVRSWITYIALREKNGTQKEHKDIAKACKEIFAEQFPTCYEALGGDEEWAI